MSALLVNQLKFIMSKQNYVNVHSMLLIMMEKIAFLVFIPSFWAISVLRSKLVAIFVVASLLILSDNS